jgi:hypothetical protein
MPWHNWFKPSESAELIASICRVSSSLDPNNAFGHAFRGANNLLVSVTWAKSQSGCAPKKAMPLGNYCRKQLNDIWLWCDDGALNDEYYGGAITHNGDYGCVTWYLGAEKSSLLRLSSEENSEPGPLNEEEQREFELRLEELEPRIPRVVRNGTAVESSVLSIPASTTSS